ncbi:MAG TPA: tryptophan synthase subunit alpha [Candidatus Eubacterium faecipullorum]|uniref:Tryptophan synthase alpha chain n=1 Tax=Candidatus Eubacterium faecipullorum TaxID=2838571 RepID=A0A9D1RD35_9FIRM|nr:tryptophan synthase subunit alpha [Candidatus Eubacterium faecipullorum]
MNNISKAFENGKAFIGFVTAGDPDLETSKKIMLEMARAGCDLIEIGIPFSDPIAEGPVIQEADLRSLAGGTTTDKVFALAAELSKEADIPLVFMTYLNVLFKYGYDKFLENAKNSGISGVIVPDLPFEEKKELRSVADKYGIDVISLIAPTSESRIQMIAKEAKGFIYEVSSLGVTGVRSEIKTDLRAITESIKAVTDIPVAIGFGINTPEQAARVCEYADGVIVGSAIVKIVAQYGKNAPAYVYDYVKSMKDAIHAAGR